jgi:hypothetical protein
MTLFKLLSRFYTKLRTQPAFHHDVLVFYDMWQEINAEEQQTFLGLLDKGQGIVKTRFIASLQ